MSQFASHTSSDFAPAPRLAWHYIGEKRYSAAIPIGHAAVALRQDTGSDGEPVTVYGWRVLSWHPRGGTLGYGDYVAVAEGTCTTLDAAKRAAEAAVAR